MHNACLAGGRSSTCRLMAGLQLLVHTFVVLQITPRPKGDHCTIGGRVSPPALMEGLETIKPTVSRCCHLQWQPAMAEHSKILLLNSRSLAFSVRFWFCRDRPTEDRHVLGRVIRSMCIARVCNSGYGLHWLLNRLESMQILEPLRVFLCDFRVPMRHPTTSALSGPG